MTENLLIRRQVTADRGLPSRKPGRPPTIGKVILSKAIDGKTTKAISEETGASLDCVRKVLRSASDKGVIHLKRFTQGKSGRAMMVKG